MFLKSSVEFPTKGRIIQRGPRGSSPKTKNSVGLKDTMTPLARGPSLDRAGSDQLDAGELALADLDYELPSPQER